MSWLVAPRCTSSAAGSPTRARSARTSGSAGFPTFAASAPIAAASNSSARHAPAIASACSIGIRPTSAQARASAASTSSIA
jgi:hypothetical protein